LTVSLLPYKITERLSVADFNIFGDNCEKYLSVAKSANRTIGIYPELKTPPFFTEHVPDFDYPAVLGTLSNVFNSKRYTTTSSGYILDVENPMKL